MTIAELRAYRQVPAKVRMRVTVGSKAGIITGNMGDNIMVKFDGRGYAVPCHSRWRVVYHLADGTTYETEME